MAPYWTELAANVADAQQLPPMLVAADIQSSSYTLYLTDLTYVWTETLKRRDIFTRSLQEDTSIDLTEGADQLPILMEKLRLGIEGGGETSAMISTPTDSGRPVITLKIKVNLPGGLAPLEWPFVLKPACQSVMTAELMLPLLRSQHNRMQEIAELHEQLKEKESAIQKMLDQFETQGLDLAQVFPQAITKSSRKADRKKAAEKVKGLQPFDIDIWRQNHSDDVTLDTVNLVKDVFSADTQDTLKLQTSMTPPKAESSWWKGVTGQTIVILAPAKGKVASGDKAVHKIQHAQARESTQEDDDFQIQATPEGSPAGRRTEAAKRVEDSTDDENDLDAAPSQRSRKIDSQGVATPPKPRKVGKLGTVGVKKGKQSNSSDNEYEGLPSRKEVGSIGQEKISRKAKVPEKPNDGDVICTNSDDCTLEMLLAAENDASSRVGHAKATDEDEPHLGKLAGRQKDRETRRDPEADEAELPTRPRRQGAVVQKDESPTGVSDTDDDDEAAPAPVKTKGKLGTIGGKRAPPTAPSSSGDDEGAAPKPRKARGKLGTLGGKKKAPTPSPSTAKNSDEEDSSPEAVSGTKSKLGTLGGSGKAGSVKTELPVPKDTPPAAEETPEEKADKKRLQLKRALEEKAKQPVKKKKKF